MTSTYSRWLMVPRLPTHTSMNNMAKAIDDKAKAKTASGLQTDTDISSSTSTPHRELKPWQPDSEASRDADTFALNGPAKPWDQFETNSRLFGATTNYDEELYTTKLDRSRADFKTREKEAQKLADEILGVSGSVIQFDLS